MTTTMETLKSTIEELGDEAVVIVAPRGDEAEFIADQEAGMETAGAAPPRKKYWAKTWKLAPSHKKPGDGKRVGWLKAGGPHYFYGQRNFPNARVTEKVGNKTYTNTWWALTDDDSRNKDVWVSVVYLVGGKNDEPVPNIGKV